jgi:hypothetical protein
MGRVVKIPWVGGRYPKGSRGQYTMNRVGQYTMDSGVDIPWVM